MFGFGRKKANREIPQQRTMSYAKELQEALAAQVEDYQLPAGPFLAERMRWLQNDRPSAVVLADDTPGHEVYEAWFNNKMWGRYPRAGLALDRVYEVRNQAEQWLKDHGYED